MLDPFDMKDIAVEDEIYKENILDLFKHPRNKGVLADPDVKHYEKNVSCGDEITLYLKFDKDKRVVQVVHDGKGCAISQASASMLTDFMKGKTLKDLKKITPDTILDLLGIKVGAFRMKCAVLPLKALEKGIERYEHG
jgi:nitrogen fixation protein NifU and related proteins